jgi:ppGpp synthetase/RelA/SpoT-type nucleotidyltranferase
MKIIGINHLLSLQSEYEAEVSRFQAFCLEIVKQTEELLRTEHVSLASPIEWRVKAWKSIAEKIQQQESPPKALAEISDVTGIRIVVLFQRDVALVQRIIESNFVVVQKEDTSARLHADQFGYGSIHYDVQPPEHWQKIPTLRKFDKLRAEIQLRTSSQHLWAAASHILQYKKTAHVPPPLRRTINRVAALLETVDLEFERVLLQRNEYVQELETEKALDVELDTESLRRVMDATLPEANRDADDPENYADLLDELRHVGVHTSNQLDTIIRKHLQSVLLDDRMTVAATREGLFKGDGSEPGIGASPARLAAGVFFSHVGLIRGTLRREFGDKFISYLQRKKSPPPLDE